MSAQISTLTAQLKQQKYAEVLKATVAIPEQAKTDDLKLLELVARIKADQDSESNDNSFIVIDEVAGMFVALSFIAHEAILYFFAFLLFRLFDILKPWPISWVDKNVKGGFGILLDDLIAGFVAGGIIFAILIII